jgi:hypothetical protein
MRIKQNFARRLAAATVVVGAVGLPVVGASSANADTTTLTITPNTGLNNGDTVSVSATGLAASSTVYIVECSSLGASGCDTTHLVSTTTGADGSFSGVSFAVETGTVGDGTCTAAADCYLTATTNAGTASAATAYNTISFAAAPTLTVTPHTGLKNGDTVSVSGTGLAASSTVYIVECSSLGASGCDTSHLGSTTTGADGSFSGVSFAVETGTVGDGTCTSDADCYITATTNAGTADAVTAYTTISFASTSSVSGVLAVTPHANLKNGETVTVSGTGFHHAVKTVQVIECSGLSAATCAVGTLATGTTKADGTFSNVKVKVVTGAVGNGTCDSTHSCYVIATTAAPGVTDPTQVGLYTITFGATTKHATTTSAKASAHKVATREKFKISGAVKSAKVGVAGIKVKLYEEVGKKSKAIAHSKTKAGGKFGFKLKGAKKTEHYVVKSRKTTKGSNVYLSSTSKTITVK